MLFYWIEQVYLIETFTVGLKINLFEGWDEVFTTRFFSFSRFSDVKHLKILYWIYCNIFSVLIFWPRGMWNLRSLTRDQTCILCIESQSLNHWTTRKDLQPRKCLAEDTCVYVRHIDTQEAAYTDLPKNLCTEIIAPQLNSNIWTWGLIDAGVLSGMLK